MTAIVRIALERPYTFVVAAILALLFGIMSVVRTPKDIFPDIGIPVISVIWTYSGLPPDDMSSRIVYIFERGLTTTVNDIEHIESQSVQGYGVLKIYFQPKVNIASATAQVTSISQTALKQLPPGVTPPLLIVFNASSVPIMQLALSSPTASQTELNDLATNFVRPALTSVAGAALPAPYGGAPRQVQIDLDQRALHSYGLSAQDVVNALQVQNLITPGGTQKIGSYEYTINLNGSPKTVPEFNDLPIKVVNGTMVYVRDVAFAHDGGPPQTNVVQLDGRKGVLMTILRAGSASTLDIIAGIKSLLPRIRETLPPGVDLKVVNDQSGFVKASVFSVVREGVIAAALTGLMILLFLGSWRSTLIISISIPLSILAALPVLSALGETINVMTLGGFALAVGMLVDEATVTIENINWHLEQGKPIKTAILDGAEQIVVAATLSLLCICIVFVPMFSLGGVSGYLFRPLAEAVVIAMTASYLWSRTLVPTMAYFLLAGQVHHHHDGAHGGAVKAGFAKRFQQGFERAFERFRAAYVRLLRLALQHRRTAIAVFLLVPLLSAGLMPFLGKNFFPDIAGDAIRLHVRAHPGTRVEEVTSLVNNIEAEIRNVIPADKILSSVDNIGLPLSGINFSYNNSGTVGVIDADILLSLDAEAELPIAEWVKTLRETLPQRFPGTTFSFLPGDMVSQILNFGAPAPVDVAISGPDMIECRKLAADLLARISHVPGVADPRIQQVFQGPALNVEFNRMFGGLVGLTEHDAASTLQNTLAGSSQTTPVYWLDPRTGVSYAVSVQTPQYRIDTLDGLKTMPVTSGPASTPQLLGGLATMSPGPESAVVTHYNIRPAIDIYATTQGRDLGGVTDDIRKIVDESRPEWGKGIRVVMRGQVATMDQAYGELFFGLAFAVVLVYLLIVVNFQSWLDPFIVIMALPMALAGIIWMLFVTGTTLSVPTLTGAIMCMGVATANSILVISFARERLAAGADAVTAAIEAGRTRLRPVLMTALAMIIGMVPMAVETGQNAPLGRAVIGGLVLATSATLFFVPTLFSLFHRRDERKVNTAAGAPQLGGPLEVNPS